MPVILLFGLGDPLSMVFSLIHGAFYVWAFRRLARRVGRLVGDVPRRQAMAAVVIVAALGSLSFVPIYGSGENLAGGGKLVHNADEIYQQSFREAFR